ncbi:hypothetical protein PQX77_017772 [Marasmius sp. AFHP31]|nr:hypothetical protein PQX77_017772 [Marasmius sp. AFHP31]
MLKELTKVVNEGSVVKATIGVAGETVVLPGSSSSDRLTQIVKTHYKEHKQMLRLSGHTYNSSTMPHFFAVPFNPFCANQGEVRFYFVNGWVVQAMHTCPISSDHFSPTVESHYKESELQSGMAVRDATNRLVPLEELTTGKWDDRVSEHDHQWIDLSKSSKDLT